MVAWRGQDSWPSPREEGRGGSCCRPHFSFRPIREEAELGKRVVQAAAVPPGQAGTGKQEAGLGS